MKSSVMHHPPFSDMLTIQELLHYPHHPREMKKKKYRKFHQFSQSLRGN